MQRIEQQQQQYCKNNNNIITTTTTKLGDILVSARANVICLQQQIMAIAVVN
ncbi:hypothetical protein DOY81_010720 [Sarcophaga bullata]|nr:hypothetical protein DOY81_010720 [Sarcophaga bullata]